MLEQADLQFDRLTKSSLLPLHILVRKSYLNSSNIALNFFNLSNFFAIIE